MTNTMTPSEIADALDAQHKYDKVHYPPVNPLFAQAAATIRELEASNKSRADIIYAQNKASEIDRDKLKIATEALEVAGSEATRGAEKAGCDGWRADAMCRSIAKLTTQALARIKEVGA